MPHNGRDARAPAVVIIGGGFGGMPRRSNLKKADVDVTLIDRHNHLLFQPLIYQVASGACDVRRGARHRFARCSGSKRT